MEDSRATNNDLDDFLSNQVWRDIKQTLLDRRESLYQALREMDLKESMEIRLIDIMLEAPGDLRALLKSLEEEYGRPARTDRQD